MAVLMIEKPFVIINSRMKEPPKALATTIEGQAYAMSWNKPHKQLEADHSTSQYKINLLAIGVRPATQ